MVTQSTDSEVVLSPSLDWTTIRRLIEKHRTLKTVAKLLKLPYYKVVRFISNDPNRKKWFWSYRKEARRIHKNEMDKKRRGFRTQIAKDIVRQTRIANLKLATEVSVRRRRELRDARTEKDILEGAEHGQLVADAFTPEDV